MQEYGSIIAQIVTSAAQIPVAGATLTISRKLPDGGQELLAVRMSDYDGFTEPFELPTPPGVRQPDTADGGGPLRARRSAHGAYGLRPGAGPRRAGLLRRADAAAARAHPDADAAGELCRNAGIRHSRAGAVSVWPRSFRTSPKPSRSTSARRTRAQKTSRSRFSDYVKNVLSSEVYPTWEPAALRANALAVISFALNRVYTEYYRSRGYPSTSRPRPRSTRNSSTAATSMRTSPRSSMSCSPIICAGRAMSSRWRQNSATVSPPPATGSASGARRSWRRRARIPSGSSGGIMERMCRS